MPPLVLLHIIHYVRTFVEGISAQFVQKGDPVDPRYMYLGPELHFCLAFAPDNRANMGLVDAYYPVLNAVGAVVEHLFLLILQGLYHQKIFVLFGYQGDFWVGIEQLVY